MRTVATIVIGCGLAAAMGCAAAPRPAANAAPAGDRAVATGTLAKVYYWRAKQGKLEEYSRYVRDVAEPIDREAQRGGGFLTVTTFVSRDPALPWTHMRVFVLRDSAQLAGLSGALDAAGTRVEPDSAKRRVRGEYSATLRDRVGDATVEVLR